MSRSPMQLALTLAQSRQGFCSPNPSVGAVLVDALGEVVGQGAHWQAGEDHAEVVAIKQAGALSLGATLYVTLVPCHHQGKTPPCTQAIIKAGIKAVVYAYADPHELVQTHTSCLALEAAGIKVAHQPASSVTEFYQSYQYWCERKRPWVDVKLVHSCDGHIAEANGQPVSLSGHQFNAWVHQQRSHHDALLTTVKTVLADNPRLNARLPNQTVNKPVFVIDRTLKMPNSAQLWQTASPLFLFYDEHLPVEAVHFSKLHDQGATLIPVPCQDGQLSWSAILDKIGSLGFHSLWSEMGAIATQSLISSMQWQRFLLVQTPQTLKSGYEGGVDLLRSRCASLTKKTWQIEQDQITEWVH